MMINDMWLVDVDRPWREPFLAYACAIKICAKQIVVFNEDLTLRRGNYTFIYSSSAFGTYEAAQRRRRGLLKRLIEKVRRYPQNGWRRQFMDVERVEVALMKIERES